MQTRTVYYSSLGLLVVSQPGLWTVAAHTLSRSYVMRSAVTSARSFGMTTSTTIPPPPARTSRPRQPSAHSRSRVFGSNSGMLTLNRASWSGAALWIVRVIRPSSSV